jgi:hypothetical protein
MARSVRDVASMSDLMHGTDGIDPYSIYAHKASLRRIESEDNRYKWDFYHEPVLLCPVITFTAPRGLDETVAFGFGSPPLALAAGSFNRQWLRRRSELAIDQ